MVLADMCMASGARASMAEVCSGPAPSRTLRTARSSESMVISTSESAAASAGVSATRAPSLPNVSARCRVRL